MAKSSNYKPSQIRVANWWFWQDQANPIAVNLDDVSVIDANGFYTDGVDSGFFELDEVARDAMIQAMKDYQLWKIQRSAEFAAFKAARVPTSPPAYMMGEDPTAPPTRETP